MAQTQTALVAELSKAAGVSEEQAKKVLDVLGFSADSLQKAGIAQDQVRLDDLRLSTRVAGMVVAR